MNTLLMQGNRPVLEFNISEGYYKILDEKHLPFSLKGALKFYEEKESYTPKDIKYISAYATNIYNTMISFLGNRTLVLSRANAKKLYEAFKLEQKDDLLSRAKVSISCKAISLLDNFWIKQENDPTRYEEVNVRHNSLNKAIAQIALHGDNLTLQGKPEAPEFTTNGGYPKAWHRDPDGSLWLYKLNDAQSTAKIEVMTSNLLDHMNVKHCHYENRSSRDEYVCACPLMSSDTLNILDGGDFCTYMQRNGIDPDQALQKQCPDDYYKMFIVDYLCSNPDRHLQNWGVYYNPETMKIKGLHPLFDHNNAFDKDVMDNKDYGSHFLGKTLRENAFYAIKHTDFHFTAPITRDMFLTTRMYESFKERAEDLGLELNKYIAPDEDLDLEEDGFDLDEE
ncbi:MAG: hypothetical protein IK121_03955 [Lachnospiraceae bacterium]|nr:hypothetical protein [Lachnospiraceae bacterium]